MKILVTGANGFIGRNLSRSLAACEGVELFTLSRNDAATGAGRLLICDVLDSKRIDEIFARHRFDAVVHLAAITAHSEIADNKFRTFATNLQGTTNLLESFNKYCRGGQFIYASTGKIYGRTDRLPITEEAAIHPMNILGKSKRITEEVIDFYAVPGNKYLICRIFNVYGELQKRSFVIPTIIDQLNCPEIKLGNIEDLRDYIYIDDLVAALETCIKNAAAFMPVDWVNIGSGRQTAVRDILACFEQLLDRKLKVRCDEKLFRKDETPAEYCSHEKLSRLTGWQPRYSLLEGISATLQREGVVHSCKQ